MTSISTNIQNNSTKIENKFETVEKKVIQIEEMLPPFAVVSPEGKITAQHRLDEYNPTIRLEKFENGEKYVISFSKAPNTIVFFSQNGSDVEKLKQLGKVVEVVFYDKNIGWSGGRTVVKSEFTMQILGH